MDGISGSIEAQAQAGLAARLSIRACRHDGPTAGLAPGHVQGNLAILTRNLAADFQCFCHLNPKPCPVIGISEPGSPHIPALGSDLRHLWHDDLVAFVIGCSFSFERALLDDGVALRHVACGDNAAMWRNRSRRTLPDRSRARWWCRCVR
jgi:uncharacterized protein YcsI (UPF0317 family)